VHAVLAFSSEYSTGFLFCVDALHIS
jgi:hypothetical protein